MAQPGENCSTKCVTKDHMTFGECMRAKNVGAIWVQHVKGLDSSTQKKHEAELSAYREARKEGIQPESTNMASIQAARQASEKAGAAYDATTGSFKK